MARYPDVGSMPMASSLKRLTFDKVEELRREFADIPASYVDFLEEVGWGDLAGTLMLYSGPVGADDVYEAAVASELKDLALIGDDYQGFVLAVNARGEIIEVSPRGEREVVASDFEGFIRARLGS